MALERTTRTLYLIERIKKDKPSPEQRFLILNKIVASAGYELVSSSQFAKENDRQRKIFETELADAVIQLELLMMEMGFDPGEILELGIEHTLERYQEFKERGWENCIKRLLP